MAGKFALFAFLMLFFLTLSAEKGKVYNVKLTNAGFTNTDGSSNPTGWTVKTTGKGSMYGAVEVAGSEGKCLGYELKNWGRITAQSSKMNLKVGHLYRLSCKVKSQNLVTGKTEIYPTSAPAVIRMESFPFTNHSATVGGTTEWKSIEHYFIATRGSDRVELSAGFNGTAKGKVWFDSVKVEKVDDITKLVPMETVKWCDKGFRYDDRGWIFVHIEGSPYKRGYQYGYLVAEEITSYIRKLAYGENSKDPARGWYKRKTIADMVFLRKFHTEYLEEMKGIADGAAKKGVKIYGRTPELLDIVALNAAIDSDYAAGAMRKTAHPLSGKSFLSAEEEMDIPVDQHKCSAFLANGPATKDGGIVFGQIFMWGGYTGIHWNVICDVQPEKGNRLVYHTYPGGIHSGADFYLNSAGIMIGETTVSQTPFNINGMAMASRIRRAAQYSNSIDDVVKILGKSNNGMYTNDWLIGDAKTNETAIFLLGTYKTHLWRSTKNDFPAGFKGFYWSNNNNKNDEVKKEYLVNRDDAPHDLVFSPWNRDIAFNEFFKKHGGKIDEITGVNLWASSPINRPHACDGKITNTEMAKNMVFLAHSGKVTLRSKYPGGRIRNKPEAVPHLSLGYSVASPVFVAEKIKALKKKSVAAAKRGTDLSKVKEFYSFDKKKLWRKTVYSATPAENWFVSSTAGYWRILNYMPGSTKKAAQRMYETLGGMNASLLYVRDREAMVTPSKAKVVYDRYNHYRIPRVMGTYLLHQLRLKYGNNKFSKFMSSIHTKYAKKPVKNSQIISIAGKVLGKEARNIVKQWINATELPAPEVSASVEKSGDKWKLKVKVDQKNPWNFVTTLKIVNDKKSVFEKIEVKGSVTEKVFELKKRPSGIVFNAGNDIPVERKNYYLFSNFSDNFHTTLITYGTGRQIEANREMAFRYQETLGDAFAEILPPVVKDSEVTAEMLKTSDLMVLGGVEDNSLAAEICKKAGVKTGRNWFEWKGKVYGDSEDGLLLTIPNPWNQKKIVWLFLTNSAMETWEMTKRYQRRVPGWALFKGSKVVKKGFADPERFKIKFN